MQLSEVVENLDITKKIQQLVEQNSLNQSVIFVCDDFVLLDEFAKNISSKILNDEVKVNSKTHPDLFYFPLDEKKSLVVEDVQKIIEESSVKPIESDKKVFIIKNNSGISTVTQNKLLKTLEEPNENVFYFILTKSLNDILPTIQSRSLKVKIENLTMNEFKLLGFSENEYLECFGNLENKKTSEKDLGLFETCKTAIKSLNSSENIFYVSRVLLDKGSIQQILDNFTVIFSKMLDEKVKKGNAFVDLYSLYSFQAIANIFELIDRCKQKQKFNCNSQAILDCLILGIVEEKVKWAKKN